MKRFVLPLVLFLCVVAVYVNSPVQQTGADARLSIHTALAFLRQGNFNLDMYAAVPGTSYQALKIDGHLYPYYPIGTPLMAAPFLYPYTLWNPNAFADVEQYYASAEIIIASIITALTVVTIYAIARLSLPAPYALLLALIAAFCTAAWSTASRGLWQHGPSMLCLALALYLTLLAQRRPWLIQLATLPLAFAYVVRPTNSLAIVVWSLFVLIEYRRYFVRYLLGLAAVFAAFVAVNLANYGAPLPLYYVQRNLFSLTAIPEGLASILFSPSRGLLVYSPVMALAGVGAVMALRDRTRDRRDRRLHICVVTIVVAQVLLVSTFIDWSGGISLGPRYLSDIIPYLMYLMIPVIPALFSPAAGVRPSLVLAAGLVVVSVFVHARGALNIEVFAWNHLPISLDDDMSRMWDWYDLPFLRGISRLDPLIPPKLWRLPPAIHILRDTARESRTEVTLALQDERNREFYLHLTAPPEIEVVVNTNGKTQNLSLTIDGCRDLPAGLHHVGDLHLEASRGEALLARRQVVSIPVFCTIGPLERLYMPAVPHSAGP